MSITLYDLRKNTESTYSHDDHVMAFAQYYASENNLNTQFAVSPEKIAKKIFGKIKEGANGYHFGDWSIPKPMAERVGIV